MQGISTDICSDSYAFCMYLFRLYKFHRHELCQVLLDQRREVEVEELLEDRLQLRVAGRQRFLESAARLTYGSEHKAGV